VVKTEDRRGEDVWRSWVRGAQDTTRQRNTCSWPQSYRLDVITCIAVKEAARRPAMYRIGSYLYVFRPCHPPAGPRRLDTWSECTADVQSARLGPDGISREYRRGRSGIPVSRRYLRNVARCTVERPSKRPSSYMPKLSNDEIRYILEVHFSTLEPCFVPLARRLLDWLPWAKESFSPRPDPLGQPFIGATPPLSPLWLFFRNLTRLQSRSALLQSKSTV